MKDPLPVKPGTKAFGQRAAKRQAKVLDQTWESDVVGGNNPADAERYADAKRVQKKQSKTEK